MAQVPRGSPLQPAPAATAMCRGRSRSGRRHGGGTGPGTGRIPPTTCPQARGVLLWIVRGNVPVISFEDDVDPMWAEYASWLLQAAMASEEKIQHLTQYIEDYRETRGIEKAHAECIEKVGLTDQGCGMVKLISPDFALGEIDEPLISVGASGKTAVTLSAVLALALLDANGLADLEPLMRADVPHLIGPFFALVRCVCRLHAAR